MEQEERDIQGMLKGKMEGFHPEPPPDVWLGIDKEMSGGRRRRSLFFMLSAAAGIALAMGIAIPLLMNGTGSEEEIAWDHTSEVEQPGADTPSPAGNIEKTGPQEVSSQPTGNIPAAGTGANARPGDMQGNDTRAGSENQVQASKTTRGGSRLENRVVREMNELLLPGNQPQLAVLEDSPGLYPNQIEVRSDTLPVILSQSVPANVNEDSLLYLLNQVAGPLPEEEQAENEKRWVIGASLSPLVSYRDVNSPDNYRNTLVNLSESAKVTYSGGMNLAYRQSKRLSVEGGLYYSRMGVNIGDATAKNSWFTPLTESNLDGAGNVAVSVSNSMGTIASQGNEVAVSNYGSDNLRTDSEYVISDGAMIGSAVVNGIAQTMEYLEVPLRIRYLLLDAPLKIQVVGGISTNLLLGSQASLNTTDGKIDLGQISNLRSLNYSGNAGLGFIYAFNEKTSILLEPSFRYYLNSVNAGNLPSTRPYAFGFFTGLNYAF